jgi:hypothetical protein
MLHFGEPDQRDFLAAVPGHPVQVAGCRDVLQGCSQPAGLVHCFTPIVISAASTAQRRGLLAGSASDGGMAAAQNI